MHLAQATFTLNKFGQNVGYVLFLDFDDNVAVVTNNSSRTIGARANGAYQQNDTLSALYGAEYARQGDYGINTNSYDLVILKPKPVRPGKT